MDTKKLRNQLRRLYSKINVPSCQVLLASVILPAAVALGTSLYMSSHDDQRSQQEKIVSEFQSGSESFNTSVASYVNYILVDGKPDPQALNQLVQVLVQQYEEVGDTIPYLPSKDLAAVNSYKDELVQMRSVLPASNDVVDLKPFWETVSKILVLQHQINEDLPS